MKRVKKNQKLHNSYSPLLIGDVNENDVIKEVDEPSYIETREKVVPLMSTFQSTLLWNFIICCYLIFWKNFQFI